MTHLGGPGGCLHLVIIGNGVAGIEAALSARRCDPKVKITIISEESDHFFSRTALVWVLAGQMKYRDIEPFERDLYHRENLHRVRARVLRVEPDRQELTLQAYDAPLHYDRLLLALGSRPRRPSWAKESMRGVGHFVSLQDLAWVESAFYGENLRDCNAGPAAEPSTGMALSEESPYGRRETLYAERGPPQMPCIIGGGLIGLELVEVFSEIGAKVRLFVNGNRLWPAALHAPESDWVLERLRNAGVQVELEQDVVALDGDGENRIEHIRTSTGTFPCDFCVVAVGVQPNTSWLSDLNLTREVDGAIEVDAHMRTRIPNVYAAGDCAAVQGKTGAYQLEALWYAARAQGRIAGKNLAGGSEAYLEPIRYNAAKIMDLEFTTVGSLSSEARASEDWFFHERGKLQSMTRLCHEAGRLCGFHSLGRRWDTERIESWIAEGAPLQWVTQNLHQASFDTEGVLPLRIPKEFLFAAG